MLAHTQWHTCQRLSQLTHRYTLKYLLIDTYACQVLILKHTHASLSLPSRQGCFPSSIPSASHLVSHPHPPSSPRWGQTPEGLPDASPCGPGPHSCFSSILPAGDSWGMLACLCTVLWHLPAVPALNRTGDPGPGPSIQKTYDLTRYLEHQLRSLAGTYVSIQSRSLGVGEE